MAREQTRVILTCEIGGGRYENIDCAVYADEFRNMEQDQPITILRTYRKCGHRHSKDSKACNSCFRAMERQF